MGISSLVESKRIKMSENEHSISRETESGEISDPTPYVEKRENLSGLLVPDGPYRIKDLLRTGNHADVYSICSPFSDGDEVKNVEAHAYLMDGIPEKIWKHRLRCMKRLSGRFAGRFVRKDWKDGMSIVMITVNDVARDEKALGDLGRSQCEEVEKTTPGEQITGGEKTMSLSVVMNTEDQISPVLALPAMSDPDRYGVEVVENAIERKEVEKLQDPKPQHKSDYQRESARLRQLERRKMNRLKQKKLKSETEHQETENEKDVTAEITNEDDNLYLLLSLAYTNDKKLFDVLPPAWRALLEKYIAKKPLKFNNCDEMEGFISIKLHEVLFFRREEKKLPERIQGRKTEYLNLMREQMLLKKGSPEHTSKEAEVAMAKCKLKVISDFQKYVPTVISDADFLHRELKQRLRVTQELKQAIELRKKVAFFVTVLQDVVPGSGPYMKALSQLLGVEKDVAKFQSTSERDWMVYSETLESLNKRLEMLLIYV